jgi:transmembrane sensor
MVHDPQQNPILHERVMTGRRMLDEEKIGAEALYWVTRIHSGECTNEDRRALDDWLKQDETNRRAYEEVCATWDDMESFKSAVIPEMREARTYPKRRRFRFMPAAAAALVLVTLTAGLWLYAPYESPQTYASASSEQRDLRLPDGSTVKLNVDSEMTVMFSKGNRIVQLERGEALFTIADGDGRPFEVLAGNGRIRDIGTRFGVRTNLSATSVVVLSGIVDVTVERHGHAHRVMAGEGLDYDAVGRISPVRTVDAEAITAWVDGLLVLKGVTLEELAREMARYNHIDIRVGDPAIKDYRVSGTFSIHGTDDILDAIEAMLPVAVVREKSGILLLGRPENHG